MKKKIVSSLLKKKLIPQKIEKMLSVNEFLRWKQENYWKEEIKKEDIRWEESSDNIN